MSIQTKHDFYRAQLQGTAYILCKESAAEYLNLSNLDNNKSISYYTNPSGIEYIEVDGILCTTECQTINDMLADGGSDIQVLIESISNYYFDNDESFDNLVIKPDNIKRFNELKGLAISYYDEN